MLNRQERIELDRHITGANDDALDDDEDDTASIELTPDTLASLAETLRTSDGRPVSLYVLAHVDAWREDIRVMEQQRDHALAEVTTLRLKLGEL